MGKRIEPESFKAMKTWLHMGERPRAIASRYDVHLSTVLNIKGCKNYEEYREIVKAEHPPVKYSLRDEVMELHRYLHDEGDGQYFYPRNCQIAMLAINKAIKEN